MGDLTTREVLLRTSVASLANVDLPPEGPSAGSRAARQQLCAAERFVSRKRAAAMNSRRRNFVPGSGGLQPMVCPVCGSLDCKSIVRRL